jgi:hypothetical protein
MVRPLHNLPPDSQPWARSLESDLRSHEIDLTKITQDNTIAFDSVNAALTQLAKQVADLSKLTADLVVVTDNLVVQQAALTALVNAQVTTDSFAAANFSYSLTTTMTTAASTTLTVPAGYSRVSVLGTAQATANFNSTGSSLRIEASVSSPSGTNTSFQMADFSDSGNPTCVTTGARHTGSGLTGGDVITFSVGVSAGNPPLSAGTIPVSFVGIAIYTK